MAGSVSKAFSLGDYEFESHVGCRAQLTRKKKKFLNPDLGAL